MSEEPIIAPSSVDGGASGEAIADMHSAFESPIGALPLSPQLALRVAAARAAYEELLPMVGADRARREAKVGMIEAYLADPRRLPETA